MLFRKRLRVVIYMYVAVMVLMVTYCTYISVTSKKLNKTEYSHSTYKYRNEPNNADWRKENVRTSDELVNDMVEKDLNTLFSGRPPPEVSTSRKVETDFKRNKPLKIPFLPNYRSQCWYERLPRDMNYSYRLEAQAKPFRDVLRPRFDQMRALMGERQARDIWWRIRCLPLIYIIGVAKCGTTDLHASLTRHPDIIRAAIKEPWFWDWSQWLLGAKFSDYLDLFDAAAEEIRKGTVLQPGNLSEVFHPKITIDASVAYLNRFKGPMGAMLTVNGPNTIVADSIKRVSPDARILVMLRNPTDRLFSAYLFYNRNKPELSAGHFHNVTSRIVGSITACLKARQLRSCVYDPVVTATSDMVEVHVGIYYPFIKDWLQRFPSMKIITLDHYKHNRSSVISDIINQLDVRPIEKVNDLSNYPITNKGPKSEITMLPGTRTLLDEFYRPFNLMLAELLQNPVFNFINSS